MTGVWIGWLACWVFSGYSVGFIFIFIFLRFLVLVGFCWAKGSGGVVGIVCLVVAGARG